MTDKTIYLFYLLILFSCKTNNQIVDEEILSNKKFDKKKYYRYNVQDVFFFSDTEKTSNNFKPILYTNIKHLNNSENDPVKIFALRNTNDAMETKDYLYKNLNGKVVSYIENNNKIIFRDFYQDYNAGNIKEKNINMPRNISDLINYLESKKVKYKIIRNVNPLYYISDKMDEQKKALIKSTITSQTYDVLINEKQLYRITVDSNFCKSHLYYKYSDTVNDFSRITTLFFQ